MSNFEPITLSVRPDLKELDDLFFSLYEDFSDIFIQPSWFVMGRKDGRVIKVTKTKLSEESVKDLVSEMSSVSVASQIQKGYPQSWTHRIRLSDQRTVRFRVAAKSVQTLYTSTAYSLVLRPIPERPLPLESLKLPQALVDGLFPEEGMVVISGPTGSGKTTLLASAMEVIATHPEGKSLATLEDPVEYNLHAIPGEKRTGFLTLAEKGRNFDSFEVSLKGILRENPDVIMCGEMRDPESIRIATIAAQTGHAMYGTVHTNSVASTFSRIGLQFSDAERNSFLAALVDSARLYIHQRLYPRVGGGRVPVIEYCAFNPADRVSMLSALNADGLSGLTQRVQTLVETQGQSFVQSAKAAHEAGAISDLQFEEIMQTRQIEEQSLI